MKKYVLFTNNISGIGGAELYIIRKSNYLENIDYKVYIITGNNTPINLNDFNKINTIEIKEVLYPTNVFNANKKSKIMNTICNFIDYNIEDKIYIESHQTGPALWAEIFASQINSTNIVYALAPFSIKRTVYNYYFNEKLNRNEFLGCNKTFIKSNFPNIETTNNYINIPFDKDEIKILNCIKKDSTYDLNILTISRVEKTYLQSSIIEISKLARDNKEINIKYDIYTDKTSGDLYEKLRNIINEYQYQNLIVNLKGPVNPLNNCVFKNQDIFIGMGTSLLNASSMKLPSLVVDYRNNKCYGFFGEDYFEFGSGEYTAQKECSYFIMNFVKNINEKTILGDKAYELFINEFENKAVNERFINYIEEHSCKFETNMKMPNGIFDFRDFFDSVLIRLFGIKISLKIRKYIINILHSRKII